MTEAERQADAARKAARAAVAPGSEKWNDPAYLYSEADVKSGNLTGAEISSLIASGRFGPEVGADRHAGRLRWR